MEEGETIASSPTKKGIRPEHFAVYSVLFCAIYAIYHFQKRMDFFVLSNEEEQDRWVGFVTQGQLGNQLWELASTYGIARRRKARWCVMAENEGFRQYMEHMEWTSVAPPESCPGITWINPLFWYTPSLTPINDDGKYAVYYEKFLLSKWPRIRIDSNLQSFKYFDEINPIPFRLTATSEAIAWVKQRNITAAIHIRRGDKMSCRSDVVPPIDYFRLAIHTLNLLFPPPHPHDENGAARVFVVVTDDPLWVKQHPSLFKGMHILSSQRPDFDMAVIAACQHKILSIGTFGWWGAFLSDSGNNQTSAVIYPTVQMVGAGAAGFNNSDYFPQHWTGIQYVDKMLG